MLSKNGSAILAFALGYFGFEVSENDIVQFAAALVQVASFITMIYNQLDRRDVKWFFWKR